MTQEWLEQAERQERIKFLTLVVEMPTIVHCDRKKAKDELEVLLADEGFAPPSTKYVDGEEDA